MLELWVVRCYRWSFSGDLISLVDAVTSQSSLLNLRKFIVFLNQRTLSCYRCKCWVVGQQPFASKGCCWTKNDCCGYHQGQCWCYDNFLVLVFVWDLGHKSKCYTSSNQSCIRNEKLLFKCQNIIRFLFKTRENFVCQKDCCESSQNNNQEFCNHKWNTAL